MFLFFVITCIESIFSTRDPKYDELLPRLSNMDEIANIFHHMY